MPRRDQHAGIGAFVTIFYRALDTRLAPRHGRRRRPDFVNERPRQHDLLRGASYFGSAAIACTMFWMQVRSPAFWNGLPGIWSPHMGSAVSSFVRIQLFV
jgi:hypothetical protein